MGVSWSKVKPQFRLPLYVPLFVCLFAALYIVDLLFDLSSVLYWPLGQFSQVDGQLCIA